MAYFLEINERIIVHKTNPKPIQNQSKANIRIITKWDGKEYFRYINLRRLILLLVLTDFGTKHDMIF